MFVGFSLCMNDSIQHAHECTIDYVSSYPWSFSHLSDTLRRSYLVRLYITLPPFIMNIITLLKSLTLTHSGSPNLIKFFTPPPSLRKYKWHPGLLLGKMLRRYSVRLRIYSWPVKYLPSHWCLRASSLIPSGDAGRRQHTPTLMRTSIPIIHPH